jgi:hypothetical protein
VSANLWSERADCHSCGSGRSCRGSTRPTACRAPCTAVPADAGGVETLEACWCLHFSRQPTRPEARQIRSAGQLPPTATRSSHKCTQPLPPTSGSPTPAARLAEHAPPASSLRPSAGQGAKGRRWYAWRRVALATAGAPEGWGRWLLVRRSLRTGELAYYVGAGPASLPLVALVRVAGSRWRVEEAFQAGKGLCGLDQHQVRRWRSWYRWVTLAMLASRFWWWPRSPSTPGIRHPRGDRADLQRDSAPVLRPGRVPVADRGHRLRRSWWRRRQQARARACHYRRHTAQQQ